MAGRAIGCGIALARSDRIALEIFGLSGLVWCTWWAINVST